MHSLCHLESNIYNLKQRNEENIEMKRNFLKEEKMKFEEEKKI